MKHEPLIESLKKDQVPLSTISEQKKSFHVQSEKLSHSTLANNRNKRQAKGRGSLSYRRLKHHHQQDVCNKKTILATQQATREHQRLAHTITSLSFCFLWVSSTHQSSSIASSPAASSWLSPSIASTLIISSPSLDSPHPSPCSASASICRASVLHVSVVRSSPVYSPAQYHINDTS